MNPSLKDELPRLTCISHSLFISLSSLGDSFKEKHQKHVKIHLIPAYTKPHIQVKKIISTTRYIPKFISLFSFSIKCITKE